MKKRTRTEYKTDYRNKLSRPVFKIHPDNVYCILEEYPSLSHAARANDNKSSNIKRACEREAIGSKWNFSGGFRWAWAEEPEVYLNRKKHLNLELGDRQKELVQELLKLKDRLGSREGETGSSFCAPSEIQDFKQMQKIRKQLGLACQNS